MITPLRLDAALYEPVPPQKGRTVGRPRKRGPRLPTLQAVLDNPRTVWQMAFVDDWYGQGPTTVAITSGTALWYHNGMPVVPLRWVLVRDPAGQFKPRALLCTDTNVAQLQILRWFVRRWQVEVTFQEVRTHLGVETQRQWAAPAIARTTPLLLGLFSWVTLLAHHSQRQGQLPLRQAVWYHKTTPTFSDALAVVRRCIWEHWGLSISGESPDMQNIPPLLLQRLFEAVCYST